MSLGKKQWVFADGDLPPSGDLEPKAHEALMVVNMNQEDTVLNLTLYFDNKDPKEGIKLIVPSKRAICFRMDYPLGEEKYEVPFGQYALLVNSDLPVVAVFGRLDRRENMAYYPVQGFSE